MCQKEDVLKARIQPWLWEAFTIIVTIKGKLTQLQDAYAQRQEGASDNASESCAQLIQQIAE